jgi:hypothetical protein
VQGGERLEHALKNRAQPAFSPAFFAEKRAEIDFFREKSTFFRSFLPIFL